MDRPCGMAYEFAGIQCEYATFTRINPSVSLFG